MKPTEKRRTLWINDGDWAKLLERAKAHGVTPSALIRASLINGAGPMAPDLDGLPDSPAVAIKPFLSYNPAPKIRAKR